MQGNNQSVAIASTSNPRQHTIRCYGVKGTEVDQSCFNDPVKWIKVQVSEPCPRKGAFREDSGLCGIQNSANIITLIRQWRKPTLETNKHECCDITLFVETLCTFKDLLQKQSWHPLLITLNPRREILIVKQNQQINTKDIAKCKDRKKL